MNGTKTRWLVSGILIAVCSVSAWSDDKTAPRAYPDPMPADVSFDAVVKSQPFPFIKYPATNLGVKVHPHEFHVSPAGEIILPTPYQGYNGLCIAPLVGVSEGEGRTDLGLPPADGAAMRLVDGYLPGIEYQWKMGDLRLQEFAFATCGGKFESTTALEPLFAMVRYTLTNESSAPRDAALAIQFGDSFLELTVKTVPPPYSQELAFEPPFVKQKDGAILACLLTKDLKVSFKPLTPPVSKVGKKHPDENRLTIELPLAAGESKSVELALPYLPLPGDAASQLAGLKVEDELKGFREFWTRELDRAAQFIVPEKRIRDAYRACLAYNFILTDRDARSGVLMPHPDALDYEAVWAGDGSVSMQAMDRMGYHKEVESMLDYFLARQGKEGPEGDVSSGDGYFSGDVGMKWMSQNGFVLWALSEHYKLTRDEAWLKKAAPQMIKGCDWFVRERARTKVMENGQKVKHYGLLPKGRHSDLDTQDNWYWTDTYSYMGLRGTADALALGGMKDEAARLSAEADDYKACILNSIARSIDPNVKPSFVPPTPYRVKPPSFEFFDEVWYTISSPIYMVEAGLLEAKGDYASGIEYWLEKHGLYSGLPALTPGGIDPYYVYNLSLAQLLRGEADKFDWTFYSLNAYAMGQGNYATIEGHQLLTGFRGESWYANRQPHMHSNSRYLDLLRIALVLEDGETLHLMAGTPRGWLADGQTIEVKRTPSYFGEVNYIARSSVASGKITVEIEPTAWQKPNVVLHVRPPSAVGKIKSVTVDGQDWKEFDGESVKLPKLDKKTIVVCAF